jgi:hypothetical protein
MFLDFQIGFVIEQPIKRVGGIADGCVDHLGVKWRALVGHVGVEEHPGFNAVTKVELARLFPAATRPELLSVGRRRSAFAPMGCEWLAMVIINDLGERVTVGLVAVSGEDFFLRVECYVGLRRALGYVVRSEEKLLKDFVRFVQARVAGSIKMGKVSASELIRALQRGIDQGKGAKDRYIEALQRVSI